MNWPGPKNSVPNPRSFRFLVGGTLGPHQVGPLLEEILACLHSPPMGRKGLNSTKKDATLAIESYPGCPFA